MSSEDYINRLISDHALSIEMLESFVAENRPVFDTYQQLIIEMNSCARTLEAELKEIEEEITIGPHRRTFSSYKSVSSKEFVMAYPDVIKKHPQLIKEVDASAVDNAIKAGVLPEDAQRFVIEKKRWRTLPKPKIVDLRLR